MGERFFSETARIVDTISLMSFVRLLTLITLLAVVSSIPAQGTGDEKQLVYADPTGASGAIARDAKKAYTGKFRFIDTRQKDGFFPGRLKGGMTSSYRFSDPRSMRVSAIRGKVVYAFIITPDGRVMDPRILHSTDQRVSKYIIEKISYERYFPARFRGVPVYSLQSHQWEFGGEDARFPQQDHDGLGIYRHRDR